ncbi:amino acid ABC transporter permease [Arthrobacter sp. NPDC090010]|uniref:amino acid ABC transporter permease n=1 Tax=Arthrobacter sp. NPDC090010 TaxID=3363942 RepID=UPI00382956E6
MTSVLFDAPGPKAKARNLVGGIVTLLVVLGVIAFIIIRLADTGQFTAAKWKIFTFPLVQQTIVQAVGATLSAFALAAVLSIVLGMLLAIGKLSDHRWVSVPCYWIVELFRAVPLLILMMMIYYGLPSIGIALPPYAAVVGGLTLYNGSVLAEAFRAGIESLPKGQKEAGMAIGLRKSQVMNLILFPQAFRAMLPLVLAQLVVILKDTALGFIVTYNEILFQAKYFGSQAQYGSPIIQAAMVAAVIYIGMCLILSGIAKLVEIRLKKGGKTPMEQTPDVVAGQAGLAGLGGASGA